MLSPMSAKRRSYKQPSTKISTESIDLSRITEATELKIKLVVPEYVRLDPDQPSEVRVKLDIATNRIDNGG